VTIGDTKAIKRIIIHWSQQAEALWPGIFYVAASRAMDSRSVALAFNITREDLAKIGTSAKWQKQDEETTRLIRLSYEFRAQMSDLRAEVWHANPDRRWGSVYDFRRKLQGLVTKLEGEYSEVPSSPRLVNSPATTKATALECLAQWQLPLLLSDPFEVE
jgi:hypothetical protein